MVIKIRRLPSIVQYGGSTVGRLYIDDGPRECYTLEDECRVEKVPGETCIPAGIYRIVVRTFGKAHEKYKLRFPEFHKGMLEVANVRGFRDILIHMGNTEKDTEGCILVGDSVSEYTDGPTWLGNSRDAYARLYQKVIGEALAGQLHLDIGEL